ncbi:hypothetical protein ARMSODRAFT_74865 [Armillaria solidipes]|uniref:Uncharacterized protein n=1 Tax=Armillaria solidipes TaxID=1076256 RepID=A0A2H3BP60_9AGAR|nr:hypothetical protein ARMSODRAFT_74865 [Armillaria solidipes]
MRVLFDSMRSTRSYPLVNSWISLGRYWNVCHQQFVQAKNRIYQLHSGCLQSHWYSITCLEERAGLGTKTIVSDGQRILTPSTRYIPSSHVCVAVSLFLDLPLFLPMRIRVVRRPYPQGNPAVGHQDGNSLMLRLSQESEPFLDKVSYRGWLGDKYNACQCTTEDRAIVASSNDNFRITVATFKHSEDDTRSSNNEPASSRKACTLKMGFWPSFRPSHTILGRSYFRK